MILERLYFIGAAPFVVFWYNNITYVILTLLDFLCIIRDSGEEGLIKCREKKFTRMMI